MGFVEEQTEIGENDPQLLPAGATLELAQQISTQQVLCDKTQTHDITT